MTGFCAWRGVENDEDGVFAVFEDTANRLLLRAVDDGMGLLRDTQLNEVQLRIDKCVGSPCYASLRLTSTIYLAGSTTIASACV